MVEIAAAVSMAGSAYNMIKNAIETGREVEDMYDVFASFFDAKEQLAEAAKQAVPEKYAAALIAIQPVWGQSHDSDPTTTTTISRRKPPMIAEGRQRLAQLDYGLGEKLMPINEALSFILGKILTISLYSQNIDDGVAA